MLRYLLIAFASVAAAMIERAGIILHHPINHSILFVKNAQTNRWSFTKGHREPYDLTFRETAVREVFEEVGLKEGVDYVVDSTGSRIYGRSIYWTGDVRHSYPQPRLNMSEHSEWAWMMPEEVAPLLKTPDVKAWLKVASIPAA